MIDIENPVLKQIWEDRHSKNGENLEQTFRRVAKYVATNDKEEKDFFWLMSNGYGMPAGRTMSNAGIGKFLTLNNCFKQGTKVLTQNGYMEIEKVTIGTKVLSEDNKWHRVNNIMERDYCGDIFKLSGKSLYEDIYCTPNHKFLTQNGWLRADRLIIDSKRTYSIDMLKIPNMYWDKKYDEIDLSQYFQENETQRSSYNEDKICIEKLCNKNRFNDDVNWMKTNNYINRFIKFTPDVDKESVTNYIKLDNIEILENQNCKVYNLSVEDVHSYVVNGVVVHNCFVAPQIQNSMEEIFDTVKLGALTHKAGGGIGYDFSLLYPNGTPTNNDATASGPISFMDVFNAQTQTVEQGSRRGANMGILNIYHPDIEEFIKAKSKDKNRLCHFNLSIMVDDNFMKSVENDELIYLHFPVYNADGTICEDETEWTHKKEIIASDLWNKIMQMAYDNGEPGIFFYDNMNKDNNLHYIEKIVATNPCAEYLAGTVFGNNPITNEPLNSKDYGGACNLGSLFLHNFVKNPFAKNAELNYKLLEKSIRIMVRLLDNIIDINKFPDKIYENYQKSFRTIGLGVTGFADMLCMLNKKYDSTEALNFVDELFNYITFVAYKESIELSKEKGSFPFLNKEEFIESGYLSKKELDKYMYWKDIKPDIHKYGIRNSKIISIAPTGTLSLTYGNNCSSGIEPIFSLSCDRKVRIDGQSEANEKIIPIQDYAYSKWLKFKDNPECIVKEDVFQTAVNLSVDAHINMLSTIAKHIDMSVSKTINVSTSYTFEQTKNIYKKCWENGIKGCTIFRPNELRQGVMIDSNSKEITNKNNKELSRGQWKPKAEDTVYYQRKIKIGCGKLSLFIGWSDSEKQIQDFYVQRTGSGGCEKNIQSTVISMSGMLRLGGNIFNIEKAFEGLGACNSFISKRVKGEKISSGSSCGTAILNEIKQFLKEKNIILENKKIENPKNISTNEEIYSTCPECNEKSLVFEGGCNSCKNCGYTKCG